MSIAGCKKTVGLGLPVRVLQSVASMGHGGIEHFLMNVYRNVDRDLVQFDFMYRMDGEFAFDEEIRDMGGHIYRFASPDRHPVASTRFYREFFAAHPEYRVVHEHRSSLFGLMGCLRGANYANVPTKVVHSHNSNTSKVGFASAFDRTTTKYNERHLKEFVTDFFACSDAAARWMFPEATGVSDRVKIMPNGIDAERFRFNEADRAATRAELGIPQDALVVGHVGRFAKEKNQAFLLDVAASFPPEARPWLLLLGDGALRGEVEAKATELGISGTVVFAGLHDDTWRFYSAMDVFCMPSLFEGLPVVTVEAQASGLPLLLADTISRDSDLGGDVTFKPLDDGAGSWAAVLAILGARKEDRDRGVSVVEHAGFDVRGVARWLQDFYLQRSEEVRR